MGSVKSCCQIARSLVSPAEHVGEHQAGRAGCSACGLSGCRGTSCGEALGALLQAETAALSRHSVSSRAVEHALGFTLGLLSSVQLQLAGTVGSAFALRFLGVVSDLADQVLAGGTAVVSEQVGQAGGQQHSAQSDGGDFHAASPRHTAISSLRRLVRPGSSVSTPNTRALFQRGSCLQACSS